MYAYCCAGTVLICVQAIALRFLFGEVLRLLAFRLWTCARRVDWIFGMMPFVEFCFPALLDPARRWSAWVWLADMLCREDEVGLVQYSLEQCWRALVPCDAASCSLGALSTILGFSSWNSSGTRLLHRLVVPEWSVGGLTLVSLVLLDFAFPFASLFPSLGQITSLHE